MSEVKVVYLGK